MPVCHLPCLQDDIIDEAKTWFDGVDDKDAVYRAVSYGSQGGRLGVFYVVANACWSQIGRFSDEDDADLKLIATCIYNLCVKFSGIFGCQEGAKFYELVNCAIDDISSTSGKLALQSIARSIYKMHRKKNVNK